MTRGDKRLFVHVLRRVQKRITWGDVDELVRQGFRDEIAAALDDGVET